MSDLFSPLVSITTTKRRRFFWAVWSSSPPTKAPFRKPDFSGGGEETFDEALRAAEKASGHSLVVIEPEWARACIRLLRGQSPWQGARSYPGAPRPSKTQRGDEPNASIWEVLGVDADVSAEALKAAFRKRALESHPDRGGDAERFRRVVAAFREAQRRLRRPRRSG